MKYKPRKSQIVVYVGIQPVRCRILEILPKGSQTSDYRGTWTVTEDSFRLEPIQACGPFGAVIGVGSPFITVADRKVVRVADFRSIGQYGQRWEADLTEWAFPRVRP